MPNKFISPVPKNCVITQTWEQHKQRAISNGWSWKPGIPGKSYYYPGVDFAGCGQPPIVAAASGKVIEVRKESGGYGTHVRIDHGDGDMTIYAHLDRATVSVGDEVKPGQKIGIMGWTGNVWPAGPGGTHLHWELRRKGIPTDPMPMVVLSIPEPVVDEESADDEPQVGQDDDVFYVPEIPKLPQVRVTALPWLRIRSEPSVAGKPLGQLNPGAVVSVIGAVRSGNEVWLQVGPDMYIAALYDGDIMVEWV